MVSRTVQYISFTTYEREYWSVELFFWVKYTGLVSVILMAQLLVVIFDIFKYLVHAHLYIYFHKG